MIKREKTVQGHGMSNGSSLATLENVINEYVRLLYFWVFFQPVWRELLLGMFLWGLFSLGKRLVRFFILFKMPDCAFIRDSIVTAFILR